MVLKSSSLLKILLYTHHLPFALWHFSEFLFSGNSSLTLLRGIPSSSSYSSDLSYADLPCSSLSTAFHFSHRDMSSTSNSESWSPKSLLGPARVTYRSSRSSSVNSGISDSSIAAYFMSLGFHTFQRIGISIYVFTKVPLQHLEKRHIYFPTDFTLEEDDRQYKPNFCLYF